MKTLKGIRRRLQMKTRKSISIAVKISQIFKISGFYCGAVEIFALL